MKLLLHNIFLFKKKALNLKAQVTDVSSES